MIAVHDAPLGPPGPAAPGSRSWLLPLILVLTAGHILLLVLHLDWIHGLRGWFWTFEPKSIRSWPALLLVIAVPWTVLALLRRWQADGQPLHDCLLRLTLLCLLGTSQQFGFAFLEGRGLDGLRDRAVTTGHAEFVAVATRFTTAKILTNYEFILETGRLGLYAHSKPPGHLLLYKFTALLFPVGTTATARIESLRTAMALSWPVFSYLPIFPLYFCTRRLFGHRTAIGASVLYVFVPSVTLITLHTDQAFFPALFLLPVALAMAGGPRRNLFAVLAGVVSFGVVCFSYSLSICWLFVAAALCLDCDRTLGQDQSRGRAIVRRLGLAGATFVLALLVARHLLGFDYLSLQRRALVFHQSWRGWDGQLSTTLHFAWVNGLEYALWIGMPMVCLLAAGAIRLCSSETPRFPTSAGLMALCAAVVTGLLFFGKTKGEVARLWLFLVPPLCALSAANLDAAEPATGKNRFLPIVILLQWATILATKLNQDFH